MFIENDTVYKNALDYRNQHDELVWSGDETNLKAMNGNFFITTFMDGSIWAGTTTSVGGQYVFETVDAAKEWCNKFYSKFAWGV